MDVVIQAALIGLLQGLTEFIPISSSAHLELAPWIAGWQTDGLIGSLAFDVFLHLGTLVALLPGISRSGATITAGRALGMSREAAARFSFLLATPITFGAGLYGSRKLLTETHTSTEWLAIVVGFAVAVLSGMLAIGFLLAWLRRRSLTIFSLYRVGFAVAIVVLVAIGR